MLIQENNNQFFITIPHDIVKAKGWRKGDTLHFFIGKKGEIFLRDANV